MVKIIAAVQVSAHLLNVRAIGATGKTAASAELLFPVSCLKKLDQCHRKRGRSESAL
jgi:hypothetical protein